MNSQPVTIIIQYYDFTCTDVCITEAPHKKKITVKNVLNYHFKTFRSVIYKFG